MCFGGVGKASEVVEMADRCSWGERANSLLETVDDAKYCIADMQKAEIFLAHCKLQVSGKMEKTGENWKKKKTNKQTQPN